MTEAEVQAYREYVNNPENAFQCGKCPANEHVSDDRLPCGQWQCWVVLHTETWRKRGKE